MTERNARPPSDASIEKHTARVQRMCRGLPGCEERLSHGEVAFFVKKRVFAMMSSNHHDDGRLAVVIPAADGVQEELIARNPRRYYIPPYVGVRGWVGIHLARISDRNLRTHLEEAWRLVAPKSVQKIQSLGPRPRDRGDRVPPSE